MHSGSLNDPLRRTFVAPQSKAMLVRDVILKGLAETPHEATALRDLVLRLAALADAVPELAEVELDPVDVREDRVAVRGVRLRLDVARERVSPKTWWWHQG